MFTELLKLQKEAQEQDKNGLIKLANKNDSRIKRMANFLANLHKIVLPDYLIDKLAIAKELNDKYLKKTGQFDPDTENSVEEDIDGEVVKDDEGDVEVDGEPTQKYKKREDFFQSIDFEKSYLASVLGSTDDKRYFLNLTNAPITDENGKMSRGIFKENPEGAVIYLIAYPQEQNNPAYGPFVDQIQRGFSKISQEQAAEIIKYFSRSDSNRRMFPGMCLDLFAQLLVKGTGKDVPDPVINQLTPEWARMELYGRDPEETAGDMSQFDPSLVFNGRLEPMYRYMAHGDRASDAQHVMEIYPKQHADRMQEYISKGNYSELLGNMIATMISSTKKRKEGEEKKKRIRNVDKLRRGLVGGDPYGMHLAKELEKIASEFGVTIRGESMSEEFRQFVIDRWDFSSLQASPFATMKQNDILDKRFAVGDRQHKLILEVVQEEREKAQKGEDHIQFFVKNSPEIAVLAFKRLGMLPRFMEFKKKIREAELVRSALGSLTRKRKKNEGLKAQELETGKKAKLEDTREEEKIIQKYFPTLYTIAVDPKTGQLKLRDDNSAQVMENNARRKDVIRDVGEVLSLSGGMKELKEEAAASALSVAYSYANPIYETSAELKSQGDEGEGRELGTMVADPREERDREKRLDNFEKTMEEVEAQGYDIDSPYFDTRARALFHYLSESSRKVPALLGFRKAYSSGIPAEFNKYLAIVKDMMLRMRSKEQRKEEINTFSEDDLVDTNWMEQVETEHGKKVTNYTVLKDGTTSVSFEGETGQTIINSVPRTQDVMVKQEEEQTKQEEDEVSGKGTGRRILEQAVKWMKEFDSKNVEVISDLMEFNTEDPEGAIKNDIMDRQVARQIVLDEDFHKKFIEFMRQQQTANPNWAFDGGYAPKQPPGSIDISERTFRLGRLFAYLHFVCGIGTVQFGFITMDGGNALHLFRSYLDVIRDFYGKLDGHQTDLSKEEMDSALYTTKKEVKLRDGTVRYISNYKEISDGKKGEERFSAISNREGVCDVDNVVMLASQYFDHARALNKYYKEMNYSDQRGKALYLMRLKYLMDAFRIGQAKAELGTAFSILSREGDNLSSVKAVMGDFTVKTSLHVNEMAKVMAQFDAGIVSTEEGEPVVALARDSLGQINKIKESFDVSNTASIKRYVDSQSVIEDLSGFFKNYEIAGEPISPVKAENSVEIYNNYMEYIKSRYDAGSDEPRPAMVAELADRFSKLNNVDVGEIITTSDKDLQQYSERFYSAYNANMAKLEEVITTGKKPEQKAPVAEEINGNGEVVDESAEPEVTDIKEEVKTVVPPVQPAVAPIAPVVAPVATVQPSAAVSQNPQAYAERMKMIQKLFFKNVARGTPFGSPDHRLMRELGFGLDETNGRTALVNSYPQEFIKWQADEAAKKRAARAMSNMDKFIIFSNSEIDYILERFAV